MAFSRPRGRRGLSLAVGAVPPRRRGHDRPAAAADRCCWPASASCRRGEINDAMHQAVWGLSHCERVFAAPGGAADRAPPGRAAPVEASLPPSGSRTSASATGPATRPRSTGCARRSRRARPWRSSGRRGPGRRRSTSLLLRFADPTEGPVPARRPPRCGLEPEDAPSLFALVPQDTFLFHETVRRNLRWPARTRTSAELWAAPRAAGAQGFISRLPEGFDTVVGERGMRLSGGERQRIAIARAAAQGRADPDPGRGDLERRRRGGGGHPGVPRRLRRRPDHADHRAPPVHRPRSRPHPRARARAHRRVGHARASCSMRGGRTRGWSRRRRCRDERAHRRPRHADAADRARSAGCGSLRPIRRPLRPYRASVGRRRR